MFQQCSAIEQNGNAYEQNDYKSFYKKKKMIISHFDTIFEDKIWRYEINI